MVGWIQKRRLSWSRPANRVMRPEAPHSPRHIRRATYSQTAGHQALVGALDHSRPVVDIPQELATPDQIERLGRSRPFPVDIVELEPAVRLGSTLDRRDVDPKDGGRFGDQSNLAVRRQLISVHCSTAREMNLLCPVAGRGLQVQNAGRLDRRPIEAKIISIAIKVKATVHRQRSPYRQLISLFTSCRLSREIHRRRRTLSASSASVI